MARWSAAACAVALMLVPARARAECVDGDDCPGRDRAAAPLALGFGFDLGAADVVALRSSTSFDFDARMYGELSSQHLAALLGARLAMPWGGTGVTSSDESVCVGIDALARYYATGGPVTPFASAGLAWMLTTFQPAGQRVFETAGAANDSSGVATSLEVGLALFRGAFMHSTVKARVDLPFFSLKDAAASQTHWFSVGSLVAGFEFDRL